MHYLILIFVGTKNSQIVYSLLPSEFSGNFSINKKTGVITPSSPLDFEALPISKGLPELSVRPIKVTIKATDLGTPSLSSNVSLIVYLKDVNDNTPAFERDFYKRSIPEDLPGGTSILQVNSYLFSTLKSVLQMFLRRFDDVFIFCKNVSTKNRRSQRRGKNVCCNFFVELLKIGQSLG